MSNDSVVRGMILAAGLGTRLRPLTLERAKPSVPFLDRRLIDYSLDLFMGAGVRDIVINLHHRPESVVRAVIEHQDRLGPPSRQARIFFSSEPEILGTAGALNRVAPILEDGDFFVANGKIYFEQDLNDVLKAHRESGAWVTMVLKPHRGWEPYTPVLMDDEGRITEFALHDQVEDLKKTYVFTGVQVISPKLLEVIPDGFSDTVRDIYPKLMAEGSLVRGFVSEAFWCECSTPELYFRNSFEVLRRRGLSRLVGEGVSEQFKDVIAAQDVRFSSDCRVEKSILWEGARVEPGVSLRNAIITSGVTVPAGTSWRNVIISPRLDRSAVRPVVVAEPDEPFLVWPLKVDD